MFGGTHQKWLFEWSHGSILLPARSAGESSFQDSRLGACAHVHPHLSSSPLLSLVRTPISTLPLNERWYTFGLTKRTNMLNGYCFRLTLFWGVAGISVIFFGEVVHFSSVKNSILPVHNQ